MATQTPRAETWREASAWIDSEGFPAVLMGYPHFVGEPVCGQAEEIETRIDPDATQGWGVKPYNWAFDVGLQREIVPRVSATVTSAQAPLRCTLIRAGVPPGVWARTLARRLS